MRVLGTQAELQVLPIQKFIARSTILFICLTQALHLTINIQMTVMHEM